jgi:aryl-alcohol dehydrogenase-like predicted oxidoreductase
LCSQCRGFLTGAVTTDTLGVDDFRLGDPRFQDENLERNRALVAEVWRLAAEREVTPAQLALAWLLARGDDVVPIPGTRRVARLAENAGSTEIELSPADLDRLEAAVPRAAWSGDRQSFAAHRTVRTSV